MTTDTYVQEVDAPDFTIAIGDGASPETFTAKCTINKSRGFNRTTNIQTNVVPNCTTPSAPGKTKKKVTSFDWDVDGSGVLNVADAVFFDNWATSGLPKNIKISVGSVTGAMIFTGPALCQTFSLTGAAQGDLVEATIKLTGYDIGTTTSHV